MSFQPFATQPPVRAPRSLQERDGETFCTPSTSKRFTDTTTSKRFRYPTKRFNVEPAGLTNCLRFHPKLIECFSCKLNDMLQSPA